MWRQRDVFACRSVATCIVPAGHGTAFRGYPALARFVCYALDQDIASSSAFLAFASFNWVSCRACLLELRMPNKTMCHASVCLRLSH